MRTVLRNTLLLLLASALFLGGMIAYVKLTQHRLNPQSAIDVSVLKDIVWPWQNAELRIHYSGEEGAEVVSLPPPPADLVFLLDTSGSMSEADLNEAKRELLQFPVDLKQNIRLAVIEFATTARVLVPFTRDYEGLRSSIFAMKRGAGTQTSFLEALRQALKILEGQPQSNVVMLTDGGAGESLQDLRAFYEQEWRPSGHELYMIGIGPEGVNPDSFMQLTDDPSHYVIRGMDRGAISQMMREVRARMGNVLGLNGILKMPLAVPLWQPTKQESTFTQKTDRLPRSQMASGPYALGSLFHRQYHWVLPLRPKMGGILTTLMAPAELTYTDKAGKRRLLNTSGNAPKVLAVTFGLLFWLLLPALLYVLAALLDWALRGKPVVSELPAENYPRVYRPPPNLALRFLPEEQRIQWTPALVIGLGRGGRHVLTHLKQSFGDSVDDSTSRPLLLSLDVAREEVLGRNPDRVPGVLMDLDEDQMFMLPPQSCALDTVIHENWPADDPRAVLDLRPFKNLGLDALHLSKGTNGEAILARLALLNDFSRGPQSALLLRLQSALSQWRLLMPQLQHRQVVVVANVHGGVGKGWLTDFLILLRRMVKMDEEHGKAVEILVLLLGDSIPQGRDMVPLQASTLFAELDRLAGAGRIGFRHCLSANPGDAKELLDSMVERRPHDHIFIMQGKREGWKADLYPAAADALCLLLDRERRIQFTQLIQSLQVVEAQRRVREGRESYTEVSVHNASFPRSFYSALIANRLGNLLAGKQVLFPGLDMNVFPPQYHGAPLNPELLLQAGKELREGSALNDGNTEVTALDVLRNAALGKIADLEEQGFASEEFLQAAHELCLAIVNRTNEMLIAEEQRIGLVELSRALLQIAENLKTAKREEVKQLAQSFTSLAGLGANWIEIFLGTRALDEIGLAAPKFTEAGISGFVRDEAVSCEQDLKRLWEWQSAKSRVLVGPLTNLDPSNLQGCSKRIDDLVRGEFLKAWLGDKQVALEPLLGRCHWEIAMPSLDGKQLGIHLVFRGTKTKRYTPSLEQVAQFRRDLLEEVTSVLDVESDFHVLELLNQNLSPLDPKKLQQFAERLKSDLRGERSSLIVSLPTAPDPYPENLRDLRQLLKRILTIDTAGAAEIVYTCDSNDRHRIAALQLLPLLQAPVSPSIAKPLHSYERLRHDNAESIAKELGIQQFILTPTAGIALQNNSRLREFAALYSQGHIKKWELDGLWRIRDAEDVHLLTSVPEQTLADAAAYFVVHTEIEPKGGLSPAGSGTLPPCDDPSFADLLQWLLQKRTQDDSLT